MSITSLREALSSWIGARIDAAYVTPETGLLALSFYAGQKRLFGAGVGPRVAGVGLLPRAPRLRATAAHPLVAALRAHWVGHRLRAVEVRPDGLALVAGGGEGPAARLEIIPGRRGEVRLLAEEKARVVCWPRRAANPSAAARPVSYPADLEAAGAALVQASDAAAAAIEHVALLRAVRLRRAALERRAEAVRGDLARLDRVAEFQKIGRLLLAQGQRVPRGAAKATLEDWEAGGALEIGLDPARPARAQADDFFAKARRYQRGEAVMRSRLAETERALEATAALEAEIAAATPEPDRLDALAARARAVGAPATPATRGEPPRRTPKAPARRPYQRFHGGSGRAILVGRGGADNDALTTKHARPHDLWLHAKGAAGAHVVVPLDKGSSCPPDLLVDAATLAAHFSDARGEATCEVSYLPRRYVRKPRGSAPGAVTLEREKVIVVRIEAARLARLLSTKESASS